MTEIPLLQFEIDSDREMAEEEVAGPTSFWSMGQEEGDDSTENSGSENSSTTGTARGSAGGAERNDSPAHITINAISVNNYYTNCFCNNYKR